MTTSAYGAHLPGGADLRPAATLAAQMDFKTFQVFLHGPTSSKMPTGTEEFDARFVDAVELLQAKVFVHGPYLMNFGSARDEVRSSSIEMLRRNLDRSERIRAEGVIFHGGSSTGASRLEGLRRLNRSLMPLLRELPEDGPRVILEPTAGQGDSLVSTVESIGDYLNSLDNHPKLGLCLDICHLLAAGEPLDEEDGAEQLIAKLKERGLWERVMLFHANDSTFERGSHKDRHANLGHGHVHPATWNRLMETGVPLILETPGEHFHSDTSLLKRLTETKEN